MKTKLLKKIIASALLIILMLTMVMPLVSCAEKFTIYSCGSGFYFNRNGNKQYEIKELGAVSNSNYFYLEDYFVSEKLGKEYKIKKGFFTVGSVFLAKKSEYYNSEVYSYNLDDISGSKLTISPEMNYVEIRSSNPDVEKELYIYVEKREIPLDLTFENVNIKMRSATPVMLSASAADINIILKGENYLAAGDRVHTKKTFAEYVEDGLEYLEDEFNNDVEFVIDEVDYVINGIGNESVLNFYEHYATQIADISLNLMEDLFDGVLNVFGGKEGEEGLDGVDAIMHPAGLSFAGKGSITVKGGKGARGGDASKSVLGMADGGPGGDGGSAVLSASLLTKGARVTLEGGAGGSGGNPSKGGFGLFGSSGKQGATGRTAKSEDIGVPYKEKY